MASKKLWKKIFRWQQEDGWCGPAVIQMALAAGGIRVPQKKIAKEVFQPWWGTNQQTLFSYLSQYFKRLNFKEGGYLKDVQYHLAKGHIVIVNWWDDTVKPNEDENYGHYSLLLKVDRGKGKVTLADPAGGAGIRTLNIKDFNSHWYDSLDVRGKKWVEGFMLWVDPESRITEQRENSSRH